MHDPEGNPRNQQRLIFSRKDFRTLLYNIRDGEMLHLGLRLRGMDVVVIPIEFISATLTLTMDLKVNLSDDDIENVNLKIQANESVPPEDRQRRLNIERVDFRLVIDHHIQEGLTVRMISRQPGDFRVTLKRIELISSAGVNPSDSIENMKLTILDKTGSVKIEDTRSLSDHNTLDDVLHVIYRSGDES